MRVDTQPLNGRLDHVESDTAWVRLHLDVSSFDPLRVGDDR